MNGPALGYASDEDARRDLHEDDLLDDSISRYEVFLPAVQSLVNALGGYEEVPNPTTGKLETIYRPGDSVLAVLKDLKKLWRKDDADDERTVARCMFKAGAMKELVALLVECTDRGDWGRKVALVACDLIAALTWPIDVQQELREMQDEPDVVTDYASLLRAQVEYKAMILQTSGPLRCVLALMLPSLARSRHVEKDERIISLGLHIVRNLLAIKDIVAEGTASGEKVELANLQSTLIVQLDKLTYLQLILTLASCANKAEFNQYNVLVLDILHLIFRSVKVRDLGRDQDRATVDDLAKLLEDETRQKALSSRNGMTRHSRFGTTIAVKAGDQRLVLHKQNAITVNAGKVLDDTKRKKATKLKKVDELTNVVNLSTDAMRKLQKLAKGFIQSCFNTFFASILRDIRMERSKIRDTDNVRTFFLARFFIEYLLVLRQKEADKREKEKAARDPGEGQVDRNKQFQQDELPLGLVVEMAEMDSVRWVFSRLRITMDERPPAWTELQACIECFTQIEDVEVAEILQNQIYYNYDILDSSLEVVTRYKDQSVGYLDSVVHFAYVLLRMLEKYSKNKSFMFVRKRRAARSKRKAKEAWAQDAQQGTIPEEYGDEEEDMREPDREASSYAEHQFTFKSFEQRFAQEAVVTTLLAYLSRYKEFDDADQLKRVVGLMHRQVIKSQAEGLYFKVTCFNLFQGILEAQVFPPKTDSSRDLIQLITFILRKFFKRVKEDPFVIVEALTSKGKGKWKHLSSYQGDEDDGMAVQNARFKEKMAKGPAELEFMKKKKLSWSQQMEVVVAVLLQAGHEDWIQWIVEVLEVALAMRTEIVLSTNALREIHPDDSEDEDRVRNFAGPSKEATDNFAQHDLEPDNDERKAGLTKDAHFRLMLKLLSFDRTEDEKAEDQKWFIPASVLPVDLTASLGALRQFLANPPNLDEDPKYLIRTRRRRRARADSSSEASMDEDGHPKPELHKVRRKKAVETQVFKSAAFIEDSDDDEERDMAFFARERVLRQEMEELARRQGNDLMDAGRMKRKRKGKGKERNVRETQLDEEDMEMLQRGRSQSQGTSRQRGGSPRVETESDEEAPRRKRRSSPLVAPLSDQGSEGASSLPLGSAGVKMSGRVRRIVDTDSDE